jgi:hypothetical protein
VLLKKSLDVKETLGRTFEDAQRANPIAIARLLLPNERSRVTRTAPRQSTWPSQAPENARAQKKMLKESLHDFWSLADRWRLSTSEQCALLDVSMRTLARWRTRPPTTDAVTLDRLRIISLTYRQILERTGGLNDNNVWLLRKAGSAGDPESPSSSILHALSERSVPTMLRHHRRLESMVQAR